MQAWILKQTSIWKPWMQKYKRSPLWPASSERKVMKRGFQAIHTLLYASPCLLPHQVVHPCGNISWNVRVEDCCFTDGFAELFIENNIEFGSYALLRHVGNFTFEVLMFDREGFSLNLAGIPTGVSNTLHTPDDFLVYVESSFQDLSYRKLYGPPSFLYVPKETSKKFCEAFLVSCSDMRNRLRIFYGDDDCYFVTGVESILRQVQMTFELKRHSTLFFLRHGRGEALLLVISSCGVEKLPKKTHVYEIRSTGRSDYADLA